MIILSNETKEKVKNYLKKNEGATSIVWGEDSCTILDEKNEPIDDFMIDVEEDGEVYCTAVSCPSVTLLVD